MKLPRGLARFNKVVTNPVQGMWAPRLVPWAVIVHTGRRSRRSYRTPVLAFRNGEHLVVALVYGRESDWLRNLAVTPGQVVRRKQTHALRGAPRVSPTADTPELAGLSRFAQAYCRLATHQAVLDLGPSVGRNHS